MNTDSLASIQAENDALRKALTERNKDLFEALSALSSMWNQYCPPPWTHEFMSAGEETEEVLRKWQLIREDGTGIYIDGMVIDDDMPQKVLNLLGVTPLSDR